MTKKDKHINPEIVVGNEIIIIKANNGQVGIDKQPIRVINNPLMGGTRGDFTGRCRPSKLYPNGLQYNYYSKGQKCDEFILATHKNLLEHYQKEKKIIKEEYLKKIVEIDKEIYFYKNYKSEEDFVAAKLQKIIKSGSRDSIIEVLKELKKSDYL